MKKYLVNHGGVFQNINSAQPGTYIVEFIDFWIDQRNINNQPMRSCYYALSQANGLNYYYIKPKNFDFLNGSMYIDTNALMQIINQIYHKIQLSSSCYT